MTVDIEVEDAAWAAALPSLQCVVEGAVAAAFEAAGEGGSGDVTVLLASDAEVGELNQRFRGKAGSDRVLKAMNRGHSAEHYVRLVQRIRAARPDIAVSGDFIVGFPGESEADFDATLQLVRDVGYASAYSFKYSRRPGTPAAAMTLQVPEDEKADRLSRLQALLVEQQRAFNARLVGLTAPVLFERPGRHPGQVLGRSPYLQAVHVEGPERMIGRILPVTIMSAAQNSLAGALDLEPA